MKIKELLNLLIINLKIKLRQMSNEKFNGDDSVIMRLRTGREDFEQNQDDIAKPIRPGYLYEETPIVNTVDYKESKIRDDEYGPASNAVPAYEETNSPSGKIRHDINIQPLDYGFIVRVGCQTVAIESKERLLTGLTKYYANPDKAQKDWFKGDFFKD